MGITDYRMVVLDYNNAGINQTQAEYVLPESNQDPCNAYLECPKGIEFSPDGNCLYYTAGGYHAITTGGDYILNNSIKYIQFSNGAVNNLAVPNDWDFRYGMIERGYDPDQVPPQNQALYFIASDRLAKLKDPNNPNTSIWVDPVITFPSSLSLSFSGTFNSDGNLYCLPDQIDGENYDTYVRNTSTLAITSPNNAICNGVPPSTILTASTGFSGYVWSTPATTQSITVNSPGTYTVTVTYACNQTASTSYTVLDCCHDFSNNLSNYITSDVTGNYDVNDNILVSNNGGTIVFDGKFDIKEGKTITVDAGTTLRITNGSHLYSCLNMWGGIRFTNNTGILIIDQNSEIEDAENAIFADAGGGTGPAIQLDNAWFNNNHKSIYLLNGDFGSALNYIRNNCRFTCSAGYNLKPPHATQRTSDQIFLSNVSHISIGVIGINSNSFSDADYGIHGESSNADIYNNEFTNFTDNMVNGNFGYGIYIRRMNDHLNIGNANPGWGNYFISCSVGARVIESGVVQSAININGNTFYDCGEGVWLTNNVYVQNVNVSDNVMDDMYDGIKAIGNDYSRLNIERNRITTFNASSNPDAAITVGNLFMTGSPGIFTLIDNNVIYSYGTYGILINGESNTNVHENRVYMNQSNLQSSVYGITCNNASYSNIQCNEVDENASGDKNHKIAFKFFDFHGNDILCNTSDGNGFGLQFIGNCLKNKIRANLMQNSNHGLYIGFSPAWFWKLERSVKVKIIISFVFLNPAETTLTCRVLGLPPEAVLITTRSGCDRNTIPF